QPSGNQGRRRGRGHLASRRHRQCGRGRAGPLQCPRDPHALGTIRGPRSHRGGEKNVKPAPFEYVTPSSAAEAVDALGGYGDEAKVLAGGQSLIPMLALRLARPAALVDINRCADLNELSDGGGAITVGALARQRDLERWARLRSPLVAEVLASVAHEPIRNRGTVVGNLVHADPASELPALFLCLD